MTATTQDTTTSIPSPTPSTLLPVDVTSSLVPGTPTQVTNTARQHRFTIDEPAALGGDDRGANPVEHLLAALGGCTVISYQVWAGKLGLTIDTIDVRLHGDIDTRGFFGLDDTVRPGFGGIDLEITVTGPESDADYRRLADAVEQHCPVLDNLTNGVPVTRTLSL